MVFDTAFHSTIGAAAREYALPYRLARAHGFRKYGFHGTSHQYVAEEAAKFLGVPLGELRAVSCHLGSGGASLCAISNGRSLDNSMGYSPLQGLVMSTRSGDLDPSIALSLVARAAGDGRAIESMLNRKSGLLGLTGISADIRDLITADGASDNALARAAQVYLWRIRKYLGSYLVVTRRPHCIIFTDTIGEKIPAVRWAVTAGLTALGVAIDVRKNAEVKSLPADLATPASRVASWPSPPTKRSPSPAPATTSFAEQDGRRERPRPHPRQGRPALRQRRAGEWRRLERSFSRPCRLPARPADRAGRPLLPPSHRRGQYARPLWRPGFRRPRRARHRE